MLVSLTSQLSRTVARHVQPGPSFSALTPLFLHRSFATFSISVPSLGDSITEGTIAEVTKHEGDSVDADEVVARLETDKVTIDLRSTAKGKITAVKIKQGDVVHPGDLVFEGDDAGAGGPAPNADQPQPPMEQRAGKEQPPASAPSAPSPSSSTRMQAIDSSSSFDSSHGARAHHPLIHFRYGKRPSAPDSASSIQRSPSPAPSPSKPSPPSSSSFPGMQSGAYFSADGWREANDAAEKARRSLPRAYIRQPRLNEAEQEIIMMGGAAPYTPKSVQVQLDKEKAKAGDKAGKRK